MFLIAFFFAPNKGIVWPYLSKKENQ
jgi:hypothetical protein